MPPRSGEGNDIYAIYVHAGAGFHSYQNEQVHLDACNDAAKVAISILKNGGSALDAVEIALRLMEDREITNAGFGSNLTAEGTVECDASIVDHLGRSGAVGACSHVRNPISIARLILDYQDKPLSLQRVPPNFLVGQGATEFAFDHGMPIVSDECLISTIAKSRWLRWQHDVEAAKIEEENRTGRRATDQTHDVDTLTHSASYLETINPAMLMTPPSSLREKQNTVSSSIDIVQCESMLVTADGPNNVVEKNSKESDELGEETEPTIASIGERGKKTDDKITDTVGAIAVDRYGRIAAGSSSGGIGMKHRGRIGPAALVGIGTAVIPEDSRDPEQTSVAAVTSGTGEHIATTLAASACASRVYFSDRKDDTGMTENVTEEEAIKSMVEVDFMDHPSVKHSHCEAAIGVMAVKKSKDGIYLFFCHNTDSFALASMTSNDRVPHCVMSRRSRQGTTAQGGRFSRLRRKSFEKH